MNWYYYDGAKQVGPISQEELLQAYQRGSINGQSLVWREGMANWEPYCEAFPQSATAPGQPDIPFR